MTDFYSQNRCVCSTRSHGPLLCAFCLSFHFNDEIRMPCVIHGSRLVYFLVIVILFMGKDALNALRYNSVNRSCFNWTSN